MAGGGASGLNYSEFFIETDPGVSIFVASYGERTHPVLLFSSPLTATTEMWRDVIDTLPAGWRYICYDPRGTGRSSVPDDAYEIDLLGRDVVAIMDRIDAAEAVFCGVSLGGLTGIWLGAHHPDRFRGLILANTAASFPPAEMWTERAEGALSAGMQQFVEPTLARWFSKQFHDSRAPGVCLVEKMVLSMDRRGYAGLCRVLGSTNLLDHLPSIKCPVRVIAGGLDQSTPPTRALELMQGLPDADLVLLPAHHVPAIERPAAFGKAVGSYLQCIEERIASA
jgi:3-oxoadipate enol-lactonase